MTAIIHPTVTHEEAKEQGFGGFNKGDHIPIELTDNKMTTITVKTGDDLITFCFIPKDQNNTCFECIDIAMHNREKHKNLSFDGGLPAVRNTAGITALLLGKQHYETKE